MSGELGHRTADLTGEVFGRLTVLAYEGTVVVSGGSRASVWKCRCACGVVAIVRASLLRNGMTRSCGCLRDELKRKPRSTSASTGFERLWRRYRNGAKARGFVWELNKTTFYTLTQSSCAWCGIEPHAIIESQAKSQTARAHGQFVYNGIDRKNNDIGYTAENSVPCCTACNRRKGALPLAVWLFWLEYDNHQHKRQA